MSALLTSLASSIEGLQEGDTAILIEGRNGVNRLFVTRRDGKYHAECIYGDGEPGRFTSENPQAAITVAFQRAIGYAA